MTSTEKKSKWVSDSLHGALLFALFMDKIHNPDSYSASEIYRDERLPFKIYSGKNFKTYCQTAANRAVRYSRDGTGLSPKFRELVKKARIEFADLLASLKEHPSFDDENEDEDATYENSEAEDIPLLDEEFDEVPLSRQIQNVNLTPAPRASLAPKEKKKSSRTGLAKTKPAVKTSTLESGERQNTPTKSLVFLSDDRVLLAFKLENAWDGEIYIGENNATIMMDSFYKKSAFCSVALLSNTGLDLSDANDVFIVELQRAQDRVFLSLQTGAPDEARKLEVIVSQEVFRLPWPVERQIYDYHHKAVDEVPIDLLATGEWANFVLKKQTDVPKVARPTINRRENMDCDQDM